jgi:hypothetical protein
MSSCDSSVFRLEAVFEQLLCDWVLNVRDLSVTEFAKGAWDEWTYLRYFDAAEDDIDVRNMTTLGDEYQINVVRHDQVCTATGRRCTEEELLFCTSCEDQYLPFAVGFTSITEVQISCDHTLYEISY